jgi:hypothetical protein
VVSTINLRSKIASIKFAQPASDIEQTEETATRYCGEFGQTDWAMPRRERNDADIHDSAIRADEALAEALQMPNGPARSEALKKAGELRVAADKQGIRFARRGRPSKTK